MFGLLALLLPFFVQGLFAIDPLISTPTYGDTQGAVFTVFSQKLIDAPAEDVFNVLTDLARYPEWNTFVKHVEFQGDVRVGLRMNFTDALIVPGTTIQSAEVLTLLEPDLFTVAWRYDNTSSALYAEHVSQISKFGANKSLYLSWETYYGIGAAAVQLATGVQLQLAFDQQGSDLKQYSESK